MANPKTIDSARFTRWLEGKRDFEGDGVVGTARRGSACPIATYLSVTRGHRNVNVTSDRVSYVTANGTRREFKSPKWVAAFVTKIDASEGSIKASKAIAALS